MTFFVFPILQKMWKSRFRVFILIPSRDQKPKKKASAEQKKDKPKSKKKASVKQKKKKQSQSRKSVWSRRKERGSRSRRSLQRRRLWEGRQNKERSKDDVLLDLFMFLITVNEGVSPEFFLNFLALFWIILVLSYLNNMKLARRKFKPTSFQR